LYDADDDDDDDELLAGFDMMELQGWF